MRRLLIASVVVGLALTACGWTQPEFDGGRSNTDPLESAVTPATVGQLVQHTFTAGSAGTWSVLTVGDLLLTTLDPQSGVTAYDRHTCPRADDAPCTPRWHAAGSIPTSDGQSIFVRTGATTISALDLAGTTVRTYDVGGTDGIAALRTTDHFLLATVVHEVSPTTGSDDRLAVFPRTGCASPCAPVASLPLFSHYGDRFEWATGGDTLYSAAGLEGMTARDLATGAALWSSPAVVQYNSIRVRNGFVYAQPLGGPVDVYDAAGTTGCTGTPKVCLPLRTLSGPGAVTSISDTRATEISSDAGLGHVAFTLRFLPATDEGCGGMPRTCGALATSVPLRSPAVGTAGTNQLTFIVSWTHWGIHELYRMYAFDQTGTTNCSGAPAVCTPLLDALVGSSPATQVVIWDGRVYVPTTDGVIHVFGLPASFN